MLEFRIVSSMWCATIVAAALIGLSSRGEAELISVWEFQGNVNASTAAYNATAVNNPTYAPGVIGQAISLNGVNQAATVPNMGTYPNATVSVWVNTRDANSPGSQAIFHNTAYTNGTPHFLLEYGKDLTITGIVIDVRTAEIKRNGANSPIAENTWYNVAYRYDRSVPSLRLYINGAVVGTAGGNNSVDLILNNMVIGAENTAGTSRPFNGLLDDLGVWNETLSDTKVLGIYNFATSIFNYGQADVAILYGLTAGQSMTLSDDVEWRYATALTGPLGVVESLGGGMYAMNLDGGNGVLTVSPVPEPSTYCMALAGLACGGYLVRRRRIRRRTRNATEGITTCVAQRGAVRRTGRCSFSSIPATLCVILSLVALPPAFGGVIYDFTASDGGWTAEGSPLWSWAGGTGWSTDGNDGPAENFLVSPVFTVAESGQLHGTFGHSFDFESGLDGGVIEYKVNAGAWTYINSPLVGLGVTQGYNGTVKHMPNPPNMIYPPSPPYYTPGFTRALGPVITEFALGAGATADTFSPGSSIQIRFRGWWDESEIAPNPNWRITAASLTSAPVPEPSTYAMALAALACGGYLVRRSRKPV